MAGNSMQKLKYGFFGIIILLLLYFVYFVTYTFVEPKAYDFMTKYVVTQKLPFDHKKNIHGHDDIVLVVVDDKTVEKYRWPWKREEWCKILDYFSEYAQPQAVIYDFMISALDIDNPASDKKFFNSIKRNQNFINAFMFDVEHWENISQEEQYNEKFANKFAINAEQNIALEKAYTSIMPFPNEYFNIVTNAGFANLLSGFLDGNLAFYEKFPFN